MMLSVPLAYTLHDNVFQGFDGCVDYPTLGLDPYDMLSTYGSTPNHAPLFVLENGILVLYFKRKLPV